MRYLLILMTFALLGCSSSKLDDTDVTKANSEQIKQLIKEEEFKINFDYAFPKSSGQFNQAIQHLNLSSVGNSANRININGEGYYIEINKDSVTGILPFYGEQYSGYQLTNNDRIEFNGKAKGYKVNSQPDKKSNSTKISFRIKDVKRSGEEYEVFLLIFDNGKTDLQVSSSKRSVIGYRGQLDLQEKK